LYRRALQLRPDTVNVRTDRPCRLHVPRSEVPMRKDIDR
jgi:hypothetical protein